MFLCDFLKLLFSMNLIISYIHFKGKASDGFCTTARLLRRNETECGSPRVKTIWMNKKNESKTLTLASSCDHSCFWRSCSSGLRPASSLIPESGDMVGFSEMTKNGLIRFETKTM